jgi:hypothetical protein
MEDEQTVGRRKFLTMLGLAPTAPLLTRIKPGDTAAQTSGGRRRSADLSGIWFDIRDYGDISSGTITTALQATINAIGAGGTCKTIMIPQIAGNTTMTQGSITLPDPSGDPGWTLMYCCKRIQFTSTLSLPSGSTVKGPFGCGLRGQGIGARGPDGPHLVGDSIAAGRAIIDIVDVGSIRLENFTAEPGGGASYSVNIHRSAGVIVVDCDFGGGNGVAGAHIPYIGKQPAVLINGSFWTDFQNCRFAAGQDGGSGPAVWFISDVLTSDVGAGLAHFQNITTADGQIKIGPIAHGPNAGNIHIDGMVCENCNNGTSLIEIDSTGNSVTGCTFNRLEPADADGTVYTLKNSGTTNNITFSNSGWFSMDPASTAVGGLKIIGGASAGGGGEGTAIYPTYAEVSRDYPTVLDQRLVTAPRAPQWIMGTVLNVGQDGSTGAFNTSNTTLTTGISAPDGTTNAFKLQGTGGAGSERVLYAVDRPVAVGDWLIFGCWLKAIDDIMLDFFGNGTFQFELSYPGGSHGTDTIDQSGVIVPEDANIHDGAWHWTCGATKILKLGSGGNPCNIQIKAHVNTHTIGYFNPCAQYIPVSSGVTDRDVLHYARSLKGGWATQNNVAAAGQVGILDHQQFRGNFLVPPLTFATLPSSPVAGMQRYITDCNTVVWGANAAGSGTNKVMVWYNGTNWTVMGK